MKKNRLIYVLSLFFLGMFFLNLILEKYFNSENILAYSIILLASEFFMLMLIFFINKKDITVMFKDFKINYRQYLKVAFLIWIIGLISMLLLNYIINYLILSEATLSSNENSTRNIILKYPIYAIISISLLAPFIEEFVFRLGFSDIKNKYLFIFLSSFIFAILHVLPDLNSLKVLYFFPYLAIGLTFTIIFYKTKNIFSSVVMHSIHNIITLLLLFIF